MFWQRPSIHKYACPDKRYLYCVNKRMKWLQKWILIAYEWVIWIFLLFLLQGTWAPGLTPCWLWKRTVAYLGGACKFSMHITKTCSSSPYYLYNIGRIRKYLPKHYTETLTHTFITSRIDNCNILLYGLPDSRVC